MWAPVSVVACPALIRIAEPHSVSITRAAPQLQSPGQWGGHGEMIGVIYLLMLDMGNLVLLTVVQGDVKGEFVSVAILIALVLHNMAGTPTRLVSTIDVVVVADKGVAKDGRAAKPWNSALPLLEPCPSGLVLPTQIAFITVPHLVIEFRDIPWLPVVEVSELKDGVVEAIHLWVRLLYILTRRHRRTQDLPVFVAVDTSSLSKGDHEVSDTGVAKVLQAPEIADVPPGKLSHLGIVAARKASVAAATIGGGSVQHARIRNVWILDVKSAQLPASRLHVVSSTLT